MPFHLTHNTSLPLNCSINKLHQTVISAPFNLFPYKIHFTVLFSTTYIPTIANDLHHYSIMNFLSILTVSDFFHFQKLVAISLTQNSMSLHSRDTHSSDSAKPVYTSLQITLVPPCGQILLTYKHNAHPSHFVI